MKRTLIFLFLIIGIVSLYIYKVYNSINDEEIGFWTEDVTADCAVVLTGGPGRIREGFDLINRGEVQKLIISGVHPLSHLRDIFPQLPFYGFFDEKNVILERRSSTTWGNAQQTLPIVEALACRDVVLITSRLHMYRSYSTFRSVFPPNINIYKRAVISGRYRSEWPEITIEILKTIFYSIWAF